MQGLIELAQLEYRALKSRFDWTRIFSFFCFFVFSINLNKILRFIMIGAILFAERRTESILVIKETQRLTGLISLLNFKKFEIIFK